MSRFTESRVNGNMGRTLWEEDVRMLSCATLKRYIEKCDDVIDSQDTSAAKALQKEIIAILSPLLSGLTRGLTNYSAVGAFTDCNGKAVVVGDDLDYI